MIQFQFPKQPRCESYLENLWRSKQ